MASNLPTRFWLVVDANTRAVIGEASSLKAATDTARDFVKANVGAVAAVMTVEDAYSSHAAIDREFLEYPTNAGEVAE